MLIENTMFGEKNKVEIAIKRFKAYEPVDGYWLAFSGGKDSVTIKTLADMSKVKYTAHYNRTTVDPPELERFIKKHYPDVIWHYPEKSMFQLILEQGWPPLRQQRWCCRLLKECYGTGIVVTGVRKAESSNRKNRQLIEACLSDGAKHYLNPIIDWTDNNVWEFIKSYNIPYCSLYDDGFDRLGCILCPQNRNPQKDIARWPKFAKAYIHTFDKLIKQRKEQGKKCTFDTGKELFDWWITRNKSKKAPKNQQVLFDIDSLSLADKGE